jgi:hypothetical protein
MATFALLDGLVIVNGVTLSDHANHIETTDDREQLTATTFGAGAVILRKGLGTAQIGINFFNDFVGGSVYATLQPLIGSSTSIQVEVRATSAARSATNPGIVLSQAQLFTFSPLTGDVGQMVGLTATFANTGNAGMTYLTA